MSGGKTKHERASKRERSRMGGGREGGERVFFEINAMSNPWVVYLISPKRPIHWP